MRTTRSQGMTGWPCTFACPGPPLPWSAHAVTLEDAEIAGYQADHPQVSFHELSADVVDMAQLATGLADDLPSSDHQLAALGA
jgi:hypothetical protein